LLAWATIALVAIVALEAAWRALRDLPPSRTTRLLANIALVVVVVASAGGLGIVVGGGGPADSLHYVYAAIALFALPLTTSLTRNLRPRAAALMLLVVAIALLVVMARLFQTG
jgi:hypothetical protein